MIDCFDDSIRYRATSQMESRRNFQQRFQNRFQFIVTKELGTFDDFNRVEIGFEHCRSRHCRRRRRGCRFHKQQHEMNVFLRFVPLKIVVIPCVCQQLQRIKRWFHFQVGILNIKLILRRD